MTRLILKGLVLGAVLSLLFSPLAALQSVTKPVQEKININSASVNDLDKLPRIGPKVAQRILDYRKEHGNFKKIEEIMKVKGIGEKTFTKIKDMITVGVETQAK